MKRLVVFLLSIGLLISPTKAMAVTVENWTIDTFESNINIEKNGRVNIVESIQVDFGTEQKHGIFRVIPTIYRTKYGNNLDIRLKVLGVTNDKGTPVKYEIKREDGVINIKIGHPDVVVSGKQTYVISYKVDNAVTVPSDKAEFYWNVTGNRWPVPISKVVVNVNSPEGSLLNGICFDGLIGSETQNCEKNFSKDSAVFSSGDLPLGAGLTFAVSLDKEKLSLPSTLMKNWWFIKDNWILLFPVITLIFMWRLYWTSGRDKQYKNIFNETEPMTVPLFEKINAMLVYGPPKDLAPGEVGVLVDEKVHMRDITAVVIDLARRGFFTIKELPKKGIFSRSADFEMTWKNKDESKLKDYEKKVLDMLFDIVRKEKTKLSNLPTGAYLRLDEATTKLYSFVTKNGYFAASPNKIRSFYFGLGIVLMFLSIFQAVFLSSFFNPLVSGMSVFVAGLIVLIFSPFMPARTAKGRKALKEIVGLKEWIRIGAWREQIHEKNLFLEEVLPFTIVFGMTKKFIEAFSAADLKSLDWYQGSQGFNASTFAHSFDAFGSQVSSGISHTRPSGSSSSWGGFSTTGSSSGGSGFSGGSSGGGFGGGGGGSW